MKIVRQPALLRATGCLAVVGALCCVAPAAAQRLATDVSPSDDPGRRAELLKSHLAQAKAEVAALENRIEPLREEVQQLIAKLETLQVRPDEVTSPEDAGTRKVPFRLPLAQETSKSSGPVFVCQQNRITFFDLKAMDAALSEHNPEIQTAAREVLSNGKEKKVRIKSRKGHFDFRVVFHPDGRRVVLSVELVRKAGSPGESAGQTVDPTSEFAGVVSRADARSQYVQFAVFPDSYEVFRQARSVVWEKAFETNWEPVASDGVVNVGGGVGVTN